MENTILLLLTIPAAREQFENIALCHATYDDEGAVVVICIRGILFRSSNGTSGSRSQ